MNDKFDPRSAIEHGNEQEHELIKQIMEMIKQIMEKKLAYAKELYPDCSEYEQLQSALSVTIQMALQSALNIARKEEGAALDISMSDIIGLFSGVGLGLGTILSMLNVPMEFSASVILETAIAATETVKKLTDEKVMFAQNGNPAHMLD